MKNEEIISENEFELSSDLPCDFYSMVNVEDLIKLKEKSKLSTENISRLTGISVSTLKRFFSKNTKDPKFVNVVLLIKALGGSVDELVGINHHHNNKNREAESILIPEYQKMISYREDRLLHEEERHKEEIEIIRNRHDKMVEDIRTNANNALKEERDRFENERLRLEKKCEKALKRKNHWIIAISLTLLVFILFIIVMLIIDLRNPNLGYFQRMLSLK